MYIGTLFPRHHSYPDVQNTNHHPPTSLQQTQGRTSSGTGEMCRHPEQFAPKQNTVPCGCKGLTFIPPFTFCQWYLKSSSKKNVHL